MSHMGIDILYEDNHVLVAVKPANMPSQADSSGDMDILTALKGYIAEKYQKPGAVYLGLVHRLDRPASGLMLFARTSKAAARFARQMQGREIEKGYLARLSALPVPPEGELTDMLIKCEGNLVRIAQPHEKGREARLAYRVLETQKGHALTEVDLFTGRSHQIRVQFASRGWAIMGDARYGAGGRQLALFAHKLAFLHPVKKEWMAFEMPAPKGLLEP